MSKYKVGDKVVLTVSDVNEKAYYPYYMFNNNNSNLWVSSTDKYAEPLSTYIEQARADGAETAWELARKINDMDIYDIEEIFIEAGAFHLGNVLENYTYPEAAAKVTEWEKAKEEIKVGDLVKICEGNNNDLCVLCMSTDKKYYNAVDGYGAVYYLLTREMIAKTGRHIDIDSFLKQIGGEQE